MYVDYETMSNNNIIVDNGDLYKFYREAEKIPCRLLKRTIINLIDLKLEIKIMAFFAV